MRVIETEYKGYKFRSRLEARWAVFFDVCNADWEYEPEGFDLGNGIYYLPDFLVHDVLYYDCEKMDLYFEVKGKMNEIDAQKIELFCSDNYSKPFHEGMSVFVEYEIVNPIVILADISKGDDIFDIDDSIYEIHEGNGSRFPFYNAMPFNSVTIDRNNYAIFPGINKQGKFSLFEPQKLDNRDNKLTEKAYKKARQARFEKYFYM